MSKFDSFPFELNNKLYTVDISISPDSLSLSLVEPENNYAVYKGTYSREYVEDITRKTGSYKKFSTFGDMLLSGFRKDSSACVVSILTTEDLARLNRNIAPSSKKKYVVLAYSVEFDKISYPLPLEWQEPTVAYLLKVISSLKSSLKEREFSNKDNEKESENEYMRAEIIRLKYINERLQDEKEYMSKNEKGNDDLKDQVESIRTELAQSLKQATNANKKLKKDNLELLKEIEQFKSIKKENSEMRALKRENDRLTGLIEIEKQSLASFKIKNKKLNEDALTANNNLEKTKKEVTKYKLRIKSLEMEIDVLKRRKNLTNSNLNDSDNRSLNSHRSNRSMNSKGSRISTNSNKLRLDNSASKYSNSKLSNRSPSGYINNRRLQNPNIKSAEKIKPLSNSNSKYSSSPSRKPLLLKSSSSNGQAFNRNISNNSPLKSVGKSNQIQRGASPARSNSLNYKNKSKGSTRDTRENLRTLYLSEEEDDYKINISNNEGSGRKYEKVEEDEIEMDEIDNRLKKLEMILGGK